MTIKIGRKKYYLIEDLAKVLPFKPLTIRVYLRQGKIKGKKLSGNRWCVSEKDLLNYLEGKED